MKYYVKPRKSKVKPYILVIIAILIIFNLFLYIFDSRVLPNVLIKSESMVQAKAEDIINTTSMNIFNEKFNYGEMIIINKDNEGNINLIQANTVRLNELSSRISLKCNEELQKMGEVGIDVPVGWLTEKSIFYNLGPKINVKVEPIGNISINYESKFESAGINQTRHKIYLNISATVRTIVPLHSQEIEVKCEVPVAETIVVGKIPQTAIDFGTSN
ncbi:sporulation protein YunB [uncultured Clostridium sp.]|uniref:sporulation protein YunB n=1 Tax=uncultured Clostridium sp. TaxID=59620 RepID=UPI0025E57403|nr:sporulation protein YunB [uncultured Clostridium sp.]